METYNHHPPEAFHSTSSASSDSTDDDDEEASLPQSPTSASAFSVSTFAIAEEQELLAPLLCLCLVTTPPDAGAGAATD